MNDTFTQTQQASKHFLWLKLNPAIIVVVALPILRLLSFKKKLVTPGAERWRTHFCESRINQDAAAQQATCHQDTTIKSQEARRKENKQ
jgi:hypothetical protein